MSLSGWTPYVSGDWHMAPNSGQTQHSVGEGNSDELIYYGPWSQRFSFAQAKTGRSHPWLPGCYCGRIHIAPRDSQLPPTTPISDVLDELPQYAKGPDPWAVVTCHYSSDFSTAIWPCDIEKPAIELGTQLRFEHHSAGQFLYMRPEDMPHEENEDFTATGRKWRHDSQAGRKMISLGEFQLTWLYVEEPPIAHWRDNLMGRVNSTTFLLCPTETLLFEDFDIRPSTRFDLLDPFCWECTVTFRERRIAVGEQVHGWNHEYGWGDDGLGWYRVKMGDGAGGVVDRYEQVDFADMFQYSLCEESSSSSGE